MNTMENMKGKNTMEKIFTFVGIGTVVYFGIPYAFAIHSLFQSVLQALQF